MDTKEDMFGRTLQPPPSPESRSSGHWTLFEDKLLHQGGFTPRNHIQVDGHGVSSGQVLVSNWRKGTGSDRKPCGVMNRMGATTAGGFKHADGQKLRGGKTGGDNDCWYGFTSRNGGRSQAKHAEGSTARVCHVWKNHRGTDAQDFFHQKRRAGRVNK